MSPLPTFLVSTPPKADSQPTRQITTISEEGSPPPLPLQSVEPAGPPVTPSRRGFAKSRRTRSEPPVATPEKDEFAKKEKRRSFFGSSKNKENERTPTKSIYSRSRSREPEKEDEPELDLAYVPPPAGSAMTPGKINDEEKPTMTANGLEQSENPLGEAQEREQAKQGASSPQEVSIFDIYEELVRAVIRPPRHIYDLAELGPKKFNFGGASFERDDFTLVNSTGGKFECSHWHQTVAPFRTTVKRPCYIMLHGNSSSRVVATSMLSFCLGTGASVFAFDFCGSGLSEGEFVTLGHREKADLSAVVAHLRSTGHVDHIILWGRSMGASTALLYENLKDSLVSCMILDSPFSSIDQLFTDFGNMVPNLSGWIKDILKVKRVVVAWWWRAVTCGV